MTRLQKTRQTLHELFKSLPVIQQRGSAEAVKRHLQLIAHCQHRYDQLVELARAENQLDTAKP